MNMSSILSIGMPGGPEILILLFLLVVVGIPALLFIVYRMGYNRGRRIGQLEEKATAQT